VITALFMEIAVLLARAFRGGVRDTPDWALTRVVGFLRSHCADKILVGDLARFAGMSESTLLRRFKSAFGIGPMAYLMDLRVRNAVALLLRVPTSRALPASASRSRPAPVEREEQPAERIVGVHCAREG